MQCGEVCIAAARRHVVGTRGPRQGEPDLKTANNGRSRGRSGDPIDHLTNDIAALRKDFADLVNDRISAAGDRAKEISQRARHTVEAAEERLTRETSEHPVRSLLIAAAIGAVGVKVGAWLLKR